MKSQSIWFAYVFHNPTQEQKLQCINILKRVYGVIVDNSEQFQISNFKFQIENPHIKYIKTRKNLGYGAAANSGIKEALKKGAQWVVVCNQDIVLTKQDKQKLIKMLNYSAPGIVGPEVGSLDKKRWTTILKKEDGFRLPLQGKQGRNDNKAIDYVSGSCMAIHKKVFEKVGYFYEPYFLYYEDADFCVRAKRAGFTLKEITRTGFSHMQRQSDNTKEYYLARNHLLFVERNAPWQVKVHELLRLPKTVFDQANRRNTGALHGIKDYFLRRFDERIL